MQHHGRGQRTDPRRAAAGRRDQRTEPADVDRVVLQLEADRRPAGVEPAAAQRRAQRRERPPQRGPSPIRLRVRPQQVDQQVAAVDAAGHGQVGEQRGRLARVHTQGLAVDLDPRRPQHVDPERHDASISDRSVTIQPASLRDTCHTAGDRGCSPGFATVTIPERTTGYNGGVMSTIAHSLRRVIFRGRTAPAVVASPPEAEGAATDGGRAVAGRHRTERSDHRVLPERARRDRHRGPGAGVAGARSAARRRREAGGAAGHAGRADRAAQPGAAALRPGVLRRRPAAAREPGGAGRAGRPRRPAGARAGGRDPQPGAPRPGAGGRPPDPAELPAPPGAGARRLGRRRRLPPGPRGGRRLLRLHRPSRRPAGHRHRRRHRQGRPRGPRDGRDQERAARVRAAAARAGRRSRARQRAPLPGHPGEHVRHLPVRRSRAGHRPPGVRERGPQPAGDVGRRRGQRAAGAGHAARADDGHELRGDRGGAGSPARTCCSTRTA